MQLTEQQDEKLSKVQLDESWKYALADFLLGAKMEHLRNFLREEKKAQKTIYPPNPEIFKALNMTPLDQVKVVILGQDPYHGPNQANGLSFSVHHGDLTKWAKQGVLLLNSVLTVEAGQPTSHQKQGWEDFTDYVIDVVNEQREHVVFILWGAYAQRKGQRINQDRHLVLKAAHPSPLAANRGGFFGCKVFSKTNNYLTQHGIEPIDWQLDA